VCNIIRVKFLCTRLPTFFSLYFVGSNETYRIKITGFRKKLTPEILAKTLQQSNPKTCYINPHQDHTGYIVQLRTRKYAKRLMAKWHNKEIDGQKLKCQIELNTRFSIPKTLCRYGSMLNLETRENDSPRLDRSCQQSNDSTKTDRNTSAVRENNDSYITILDDQDFNKEAKIFDRSIEDIRKQKSSEAKRKSKSAEIVSLSVHPKCTYMII